MEADLYRTSEGTCVIDLVRMPEGTVGTFLCRFNERNKLLRRLNGDAKRTGGVVTCRSFPIVFDHQDDVWHVVFAEVVKRGQKKRGYNKTFKKNEEKA